MVVGWQERRTGSAQAQTLVFAPVDLLTSLPRVLGVFDRSQAVAEVLNNTDSVQTVTVSASAKGALQLADASTATMTVHLPARQSSTVRWELVPMPDGVDFARGTGQWEVVLSTSPAAKIAKHLQYLVGYPHGCIEQTTSRLLAMLLLKPTLGPDVLSTVLKAKTLDNIDTFVEAGVQKLARMQMEDGGFAFWEGGSTQYPWLNAYATHFLWKARQLGYTIPDVMYSKALQKLQGQFTGSQASAELDVLRPTCNG